MILFAIMLVKTQQRFLKSQKDMPFHFDGWWTVHCEYLIALCDVELKNAEYTYFVFILGLFP